MGDYPTIVNNATGKHNTGDELYSRDDDGIRGVNTTHNSTDIMKTIGLDVNIHTGMDNMHYLDNTGENIGLPLAQRLSYSYSATLNLSENISLCNPLMNGSYTGLNLTSCEMLNSTTEATVKYNLLVDIPLGIVLGLMCLMTFLGNAMVLQAVRTEKRLQTVSNMFIVSLAVSDLIVGLCVMPISAIYIFTKDWLFGVFVCQFWIGVDYTASTASILNLFILSLDRHWSVTSPLKYLRQRTKKRACIMISLVWFASSLWLIPVIGWHYFYNNGVRTVPSNVCDTEYAQNKLLKIVTGIFNFYVPLGIMFVLYGKIFWEIKKRAKFEIGQRNVGGASTSAKYTKSQGCSIDSRRNSHVSDTFEDDSSDPPSASARFNNLLRVPGDYTDVTSDEEIVRKTVVAEYTELRSIGNKSQNGYTLIDKSTPSIHIQIDFVYDECVMDSTTEKLERYVYSSETDEDHMTPKHKPWSVSEIEHDTSRKLLPSRGNYHSINRPNGASRRSESRCSRSSSFKERTFRARQSSLQRPNAHRSQSRNGPDRLNQKRHSDASLLEFFRRSEHAPQISRTKSMKQNAARLLRLRTHCNKKKKQSSALTREIKAARQLGVIMGAFTICFLPYFICFLVVAFCFNCISDDLMTTVTWIGYLNSTLNPILYPLCNINFRRKLKTMLCIKSKDGKNPHNPNNSHYMRERLSSRPSIAVADDY
ncbi:unnamed protein product [Owenia fusiformis]|uniref:G-protein coupled receptors family 1 profile domain-containing protein n=1 Tax=Owenia fusiformis TaxID=6347 RepID=A0A8S4NT18_OWEFU|nr:unnamed protein product [Owenia fusiformis]